MSGLLKNILIILLVLTIGAWIFTVAKSCKEQKPTITENHITTDADGNASDADADLEDLYDDDETDGEGDGEEDNSSETLAGETDDEGDNSDEANETGIGDDEIDEDIEDNDDDEMIDDDESSARTSRSGGSGYSSPHLVVAGSYLSEVNAKLLLKKLKREGYNDSEIVVFDLSQYHTVIAGRFSSSREAHALKRKLIHQESISEAYVHTKRPRKK